MDSEFWASRFAAAKRQVILHHNINGTGSFHFSQLDRLNMDDFEVEEEARPEFSCPYCYEDFDIASLYSHIQDEHLYESKIAVCPVCSVKVSKDMLSHIAMQHGHLLKMQRRQRLRRVAIPSSQTLSLLGRDLREAHLQVLLGGTGYRSNSSASTNTATDSFMSSLSTLNFPDAEEISQSVVSSSEGTQSSVVAQPQPIWTSSLDPSLSDEEREKRIKQAAGRAVFTQDLLFSTLLA